MDRYNLSYRHTPFIFPPATPSSGMSKLPCPASSGVEVNLWPRSRGSEIVYENQKSISPKLCLLFAPGVNIGQSNCFANIIIRSKIYEKYIYYTTYILQYLSFSGWVKFSSGWSIIFFLDSVKTSISAC